MEPSARQGRKREARRQRSERAHYALRGIKSRHGLRCPLAFPRRYARPRRAAGVARFARPRPRAGRSRGAGARARLRRTALRGPYAFDRRAGLAACAGRGREPCRNRHGRTFACLRDPVRRAKVPRQARGAAREIRRGDRGPRERCGEALSAARVDAPGPRWKAFRRGAGKTVRSAAQDGARDGRGHPRRADPACEPHADHALFREEPGPGAGKLRAGVARHLRAARQPARHVAAQVGDRGPQPEVPRRRGLQAHRKNAGREARRARGLHRRGDCAA